MGRGPFDDLGRLLDDLLSSFRGFDRSWARFEGRLGRGDLGGALRALASAGRSGRKSLRVSWKVIGVISAVLAALVGTVKLVTLVTNPTPENVNDTATWFVLQEIPDPVGWALAGLMAAALAAAGFALYKVLKARQGRGV